jgi:hypothetical protein
MLGEMLDTSEKARRRYYELLRALPVQARAEKLCSLSRAARELAMAGLREQRPDAGAAELRQLLAERLYGRRFG